MKRKNDIIPTEETKKLKQEEDLSETEELNTNIPDLLEDVSFSTQDNTADELNKNITNLLQEIPFLKQGKTDEINSGVDEIVELVEKLTNIDSQTSTNLYELFTVLITNKCRRAMNYLFDASKIKNLIIEKFKNNSLEKKVNLLKSFLKLESNSGFTNPTRLIVRELWSACSIEKDEILSALNENLEKNPVALAFFKELTDPNVKTNKLPPLMAADIKKQRLNDIEKEISLISENEPLIKIFTHIKESKKTELDCDIAEDIKNTEFKEYADKNALGKVFYKFIIELFNLDCRKSLIEIFQHSLTKNYLSSHLETQLNIFPKILTLRNGKIIELFLQNNPELSNYFNSPGIDSKELFKHFSLAFSKQKWQGILIFSKENALRKIQKELKTIIVKNSEFFDLDNFDKFISKVRSDRRERRVFEKIIYPFFTREMLGYITNDEARNEFLKLWDEKKQKALPEFKLEPEKFELTQKSEAEEDSLEPNQNFETDEYEELNQTEEQSDAESAYPFPGFSKTYKFNNSPLHFKSNNNNLLKPSFGVEDVLEEMFKKHSSKLTQS